MTTLPSYITEHAPWPASEDDTTAETLCRALTARAANYEAILPTLLRAAQNATDDTTKTRRYQAFSAEVARRNWALGVVWLLHAIHKDNPMKADELARELFSVWDEGDGGDWICDWLSRYGLDLEQTIAEATAGNTP